MTPKTDFAQPVVMGDPGGQATAAWINRTYGEGTPDQHKRELVWNGVEAGATEIRATAIRLSGYGDVGGIKAAFVDNGEGMTAQKLEDHLGSLLNGRNEVSPDGNMHMGGRTSTLTPNPEGVVIASWVEGDPDGSILHIAYNAAEKCYGLVNFPNEDGTMSTVGVPPEEFKHPIIKKVGHGTVVILLGGAPEDNTVGEIVRKDTGTSLSFVYPTEHDASKDWHYYNAKFTSLPDGVELKSMWGNQNLSNWQKDILPGQWYEDAECRCGNARTVTKKDGTVSDGKHKYAFRSYDGINAILNKTVPKKNDEGIVVDAKWAQSGTVHVRSKRGYPATVTWGLLEHDWFARNPGSGGGSDARDFGLSLGLFGEKFHNETYNVNSGQQRNRALMEKYGIVRANLRDHVVLLVEPGKSSATFMGAEPTSSRRQLMIANNPLPHDEWGEDFMEKMPAPIVERLKMLSGEDPADDSETLIKRMKDRLAGFFTRPRADKSSTSASGLSDGSASLSDGVPGPGNDDNLPGPNTNNGSGTRCPEGCTCSKHTPKPPTPGSPRSGSITGGRGRKTHGETEATNTLAIPTVNWDDTGDEFKEAPANLVRFVPGRAGTIYINGAHIYLKEMIRTEQAVRPKSKSDEVYKLIVEAIKVYMAAHVMAVQSYVRSTWVPEGGITDTRWIRAALAEESLSAALLNQAYLETVIRKPFQGRTGFGLIST
jgi:hypothetical protein